MKVVANNIGVDAGLIIVADMDYLKTVTHDLKEFTRLGKSFKVPNGKYNVHYEIADTWNGPVSGSETLDVTGGSIFVIDPCYIIGKPKHEDWLAWLNATEYGENLKSGKAFTIHSMGGDGEYRVELELEKIP